MAFIRPQTSSRAAARLLNANRSRVPHLDPGLRLELTRSFQEDIRQTQELIGRDLSAWLA